MLSETSIQNLLSQVSVINKKYIELANQTGENFNIFRVLKLSSSEVRLHSALLAELLNPIGSHGMKDVFLKLFIQKCLPIQPNEIGNYKIENATVEVEKWTGNINTENYTGGYIDILIRIASKTIIIENKIYAGDQDSQLRRYYNSPYNLDKHADLIYLTLDGKEAIEASTKNKEHPKDIIHPICLSYSYNIKEWLELCKKEAVDFPLVRETITQYIYLIKHLTNQTMNEDMKNDLIKLITTNPENIKSAQEIADSWENCKFEIINSLKEDFEKIANELELKYEIDEGFGQLGEKNSSFWFYKEDWCYCICFYFKTKFDEIELGIVERSNEIECSEDIKSQLIIHMADFNMGNQIEKGDWIWASEYKKWADTSWADIKKEIPKAIFETTKQILEKLNSFNPK